MECRLYSGIFTAEGVVICLYHLAARSGWRARGAAAALLAGREGRQGVWEDEQGCVVVQVYVWLSRVVEVVSDPVCVVAWSMAVVACEGLDSTVQYSTGDRLE